MLDILKLEETMIQLLAYINFPGINFVDYKFSSL